MVAITAELFVGWSTTPPSPPSSGHRGIPHLLPDLPRCRRRPLPHPPHHLNLLLPAALLRPISAAHNLLLLSLLMAAGCSFSASAALPSRRHLFCFPTHPSCQPPLLLLLRLLPLQAPRVLRHPPHPPRPHPPLPPLLPPCLPPRHRRRHVLPLARSLPVPVTGRDRHQRRRSRRAGTTSCAASGTGRRGRGQSPTCR